MKKSDNVRINAISALDDEIIIRNAAKRNLLLKNVAKAKKKLTAILAIAAVFTILISTFSILILPSLLKKVPVYRGMTVSGTNEFLTGSFTQSAVYQVGPHHNHDKGHVDGDYNKKPEEIDQKDPFGNKNPVENGIGSSLVVEGAAKELYYANAGEDIFITVHIDNPDKFEILSFTLNGYKYANNMFEYGSDLENLILKVNVGDVEGIVDYTIDAIKYVDGEKIKDVRMAGDKTVKVGVATDQLPTATLSGEVADYTSVTFQANVTDPLALVEKQNGSLQALLYNGTEVVQKKTLSTGSTSVTFEGLSENTLYQYAIVTTYDDLKGDGIASHVLASKAFTTKSSAPLLFDSVTLTGTTTSFSFYWNEGVTPGEITALSLWQSGNKLRDLSATDREITGLSWGNTYTLKAEYTLDGKSESIAMNFRTVSKTEPTVTLENLKVGRTAISFTTVFRDPDTVGSLIAVALYKGDTLVKESPDLINVNFDLLEGECEYTVKLTYDFDLQDGKGSQTKVYEEIHKTKALFENGICIDDYGISYKLKSDGTVAIVAYNGSATHLSIGLAGYTVTAIEAEVFRAAVTLKTVTLPDTLLTIGDSAFAACTSLDYIVIPESVISVGYFAFSGCTGTEVFCQVATQPKSWNSNWLGTEAKVYFADEWNYVGSKPEPLYQESQGLVIQSSFLGVGVLGMGTCTDSVVVIPSQFNGQPVTILDLTIFQNCSFITKIIIPDSITFMEGYISVGTSSPNKEFEGCTSLESIVIGNGITALNGAHFDGADNLKSLVLGTGISLISDMDVFLNLEEITFRGNVSKEMLAELTVLTRLGTVTLSPNDPNYYVKDGNVYSRETDTIVFAPQNSDTVTVPSGMTSIPARYFANNTALEVITIPAGVTSIGESAFSGCTNLKQIIFEGTVTYIGTRAFENCISLERIELPDGLTAISGSIFWGCTGLKEVILSDSVTQIHNYAFNNCRSLENVDLAKVQAISSYAFGGCHAMKYLVIPATVQSIGEAAFWDFPQMPFIFCEAKQRPSGWQEDTRYLFCDEWEYQNGIPVPKGLSSNEPNRKDPLKFYDEIPTVVYTNSNNFDSSYLVENTAGANLNERFADGQSYLLYKIPLGSMIEPTITLSLRQQYYVAISGEGYTSFDSFIKIADFNDVKDQYPANEFNEEGAYVAGNNRVTITVDPYRYGIYDTLYIYIANSNPSTGWGGTIDQFIIRQWKWNGKTKELTDSGELNGYIQTGQQVPKHLDYTLSDWRDSNGVKQKNVFYFTVLSDGNHFSDDNGVPGIQLTTPVALFIKDVTAGGQFVRYPVSFWEPAEWYVLRAAAEGFVPQDSHSYDIYLVFRSGSSGATFPDTVHYLHDEEQYFTYTAPRLESKYGDITEMVPNLDGRTELLQHENVLVNTLDVITLKIKSDNQPFVNDPGNSIYGISFTTVESLYINGEKITVNAYETVDWYIVRISFQDFTFVSGETYEIVFSLNSTDTSGQYTDPNGYFGIFTYTAR